MNIITIMSTVCVLNVHFRSALTHQMPAWVQCLFLGLLPRLLCMRRPQRPSLFRASSIEHLLPSSTSGFGPAGTGPLAEALPGMAMAGMLPFAGGGGGQRAVAVSTTAQKWVFVCKRIFSKINFILYKTFI
jgi:hypothetical protein